MPATYPGDLLSHLESFVVLARHVATGGRGAYEACARELHVDRSVLRRRIAALTRWFGTPLLRGRGAEARPTPAGLRLVEGAARLLAAAEGLLAQVRESEEIVSLACTGTITSELVPHALARLEARTPPVRLRVRRAGAALCERLVRGGDIDLGVVRSDGPPRGFASRHLVDDRLWFVLPAGHPLAAEGPPTLGAMATLPLVLYGGASHTRARVMGRLAPLGARVQVEVEGRTAALAYVRAGVGATFVSLVVGHGVEDNAVRSYDVTSLFDRCHFYLIARRERWGDAALRATVEQLAEGVATRSH